MSAKRVAVSVRVLREAVERKVEVTSLRHVAAEIDMSPSTLHAFIQDESKEPYNKNYQKLLTWYVRDSCDAQGIDANSAAASLELLTLHFPPRRRRGVQQKILDLLEQLKGEGVPAPQWLTDVKRR
jgi:hypothetical protein